MIGQKSKYSKKNEANQILNNSSQSPPFLTLDYVTLNKSMIKHKSKSSKEQSEQQELLQEIKELRQQISDLQTENTDLQIALLTITEHGDIIENELDETNKKLQAEINERKRAESALQAILDAVSRQKNDLEILIQILTEHGDVLDAQWSEKITQANFLASIDPLTDLANRRGFEEYLNQQWQKMMSQNSPLTIIMCDIDFFKQYNDGYGHLEGDECLKQVATAFKTVFDSISGLAARYGGEEFAGILPNTESQDAVAIADLIMSRVQQLEIPHKHSLVSDYITLSIGIASIIPTPEKAPEFLIDEADRLLYLAKHQGRNQIVY